MQITIADMRRRLEAGESSIEVWVSVFYLRDGIRSKLREVKPVLCTVNTEILRGVFRIVSIKTMTGKHINYAGHAGGSELKFFENREEAQDYYNGELDTWMTKMTNNLDRMRKRIDSISRLRI